MIVRGIDTSPDSWHYADLDTDSFRVLDSGEIMGGDGPAGAAGVVVVERLHGTGQIAPGSAFDSQWTAAVLYANAVNRYGGAEYILRRDVRLHLLGSISGSDSKICAALYDRFGGDRRRAVGTKKNPGPCYGVKGHCWQALAVAVTWWEKKTGESIRVRG